MAGAPDERGRGPAAGEQLQQQHVSCQVFPERLAQGNPQQGFFSSFFTSNQKCQLRLLKTLETNPYVKLLLDAMKHSGCAVNKDRHFSCEDCNGNVSGGFDASTSQIVLCQNNIHNQAHMNRVVTHELIHAFDHCRAHVDWFTNIRHLACSEVRAANLSGDCSLVNEIFRLHFGLKQHHQLQIDCKNKPAILRGPTDPLKEATAPTVPRRHPKYCECPTAEVGKGDPPLPHTHPHWRN
ncbi:mitochondrial inner membrane protease ATP23 homolog isoform X2 [Gorilla gorilla gorilla]|uniref:mitochondrial inner membrane protease ATP23 homolog isoform X2 n=1 Tax=Gorilla gorilla gorilla TaxID=9595 RepID=UPI002446199D|nr:mitochondrial inner membrane protease ATP23 homolog isoform X2 [Gorilla gorilla gorilla]